MKSLYCVTFCKHGPAEFATLLVSSAYEANARAEAIENMPSNWDVIGVHRICSTDDEVCTEV
jgi:hypothetical protein